MALVASSNGFSAQIGKLVVVFLFEQLFTVHRTSVTFSDDFNLVVWRFFLNRQTKVTANTIFKRTL